jgi:hypothetical protein
MREGDELFGHTRKIDSQKTGAPDHADFPLKLDDGWIRSKGEAEWFSHLSRAEVEATAIREAYSKAVMLANGLRIQDIIAIYESTENGLMVSRMTKEIRGGYITQERNPVWEAVYSDDNPLPASLRVILDMKVEKDSGKPDPNFHVSAKLNRTTYEVGDNMAIDVEATQDCYLTVFNKSHCLPELPVTVLFPNDYSGNNQVLKNQIFRIPDTNKWNLRMSVAAGLKQCEEEIIIVATKSPIIFAGDVQKIVSTKKGFLALEYMTRAEMLARWLVSIPLDQRTESTVLYRTFAESNQ